jgi:hypothetical protein
MQQNVNEKSRGRLITLHWACSGWSTKTPSNEAATFPHLSGPFNYMVRCYNVTCHQQYSSRHSSCVKIEFSFLKFNNEIVKLDCLNRSNPCLFPYRFSTPPPFPVTSLSFSTSILFTSVLHETGRQTAPRVKKNATNDEKRCCQLDMDRNHVSNIFTASCS